MIKILKFETLWQWQAVMTYCKTNSTIQDLSCCFSFEQRSDSTGPCVGQVEGWHTATRKCSSITVLLFKPRTRFNTYFIFINLIQCTSPFIGTFLTGKRSVQVVWCDVETRTLRKMGQKYLDSFGMWWGERWVRSFGPIFWKMKKYDIEQNRKGTSCMQQNKAGLTGYVTSWVGTAFWCTILEEPCKGGEDEEEDVRSCCMTLRRIKDIGTWKRKQFIALCGEFALGETMDLLQGGRIIDTGSNIN